MEHITKEDWKQKLSVDDNAVILDVRTVAEQNEGMQKNAIPLDFLDSAAFMDGVNKLDKSKTYYIYCRSGNRSGQACSIMQPMGFNTFNLIGGMMTWDGEVV